MNNIVLIIILGISSVVNCVAQKKVFEKSVNDEVFTTDEGPNKKTFKHLYIQYAMFPADYQGAEIKILKSNSYGVGYRYKYKLASYYSLGFDVSCLIYNFNLKQNSSKLLPNSVLHKNELLRTNNLSLELYQRLNIGRAGNMLGLYFDVGGYAGYVFAPKHIYKDKITDNEYHSGISITKHKNLKYFEPFTYGIRTRLGYNKLGIVAEYRLSDLLKKRFGYPKLPDWSVGIQLSVF